MSDIPSSSFASPPDRLHLPRAVLEQTVGWSAELHRPVTLREFVASRAAQGVMRALAVDPNDAPPAPVKRVSKMSEEELRQTVIAILHRGTGDAVFARVGDGTYTVEELASEVERGTELGLRLTAATARHIILIEDFVESGRVEGGAEPPAEVDIDLNF